MKKTILAAAAALLLPLGAQAGELIAGSTPRSINYQGRLERDNAPITGTIHLYFRVFNSATGTGPGACGAVNQPCLWQSSEIKVEATQGVFSANLEFTEAQLLYIFSGPSQKYLEVQVESDVLAPREPINSVIYSLIAKKLEDGASVSVTTLTANYQVLLATAAASNVGIGTNSPSHKLTVNGSVKLSGAASQLCFDDNTCMPTAGVGTAVGGVTSPGASVIESGTGGSGALSFKTSNVERMRIHDSGTSGRVGIGTDAIAAPLGALDVSGAVYIGDEGLFDRSDSTVNVRENLGVDSGVIYGKNDETLNLGAADNVISLVSGGAERLRVHTNGYVGAGLAAPADPLHAAGNIRSNTGVRGNNVSIGAYSNAWTGLANEVRAADGTDLLLQQSNPYYVGIGTNTPREKLHVRGTVLADYGVKASTALFTSNVNVNGDFTANGHNKNVYLTTTTIFGTLTVTGGVASEAGLPAYVASSNTFTGQNTFLNQLQVSSDIVTVNRMGVAATDFGFPGGRYLQVGDNKVEYSAEDTSAYLVGGSGANAKLQFYRGPTQAAVLQTQGGRNLALVVDGQARTLTDANYHRIQNAALWVSTGYASTPGIFVSSTMGNVGVGTAVMDPNWKLTVEGNLRISTSASPGQSYGIIFADGSSMQTAANIGSATGLSNNGDAVIQSDSDLSGGGNVLLRAGSLDGLILNSGGNIGIGTVNPVSKLNVRGGDLVLGTPVNPYASNGIEDLVVGGNTVFDGALIQRSAAAVELSNLIVANSVYLSTATGARAAIGSDALSPNANTRLYVKAGDINLDSGRGIRVNEAASLGWYLRGNGNGSGASNTFAYVPSAIVATDIPASIARTTTTITLTAPLTGTGDLSDHRTFAITGLSTLGTANYVPGVNAAGTGWEYKQLTGAANEIDITHSAAGIEIGIMNPLIVGKGGTGAASFTANGVLYGDTASPLKVTAAGGQYQVLQAGASGVPVFGALNLGQAAAVAGTLPVGSGGTGATTLTGVVIGNGTAAFTNVTGTANYLTKWGTGGATLAASVIRDDGTDAAVGAAPTAGIKLDVNGKLRSSSFQMTSSPTNGYVLTSDAGGNGTWKDVNTIAGDPVIGNEVTDAADTTLTRSGLGTSGNQYKLALNLGNANTWSAKQVFTSTVSANALEGVIGSNDYYRFMGGATASNAGYLEIATADDGTEPIYVRQYGGGTEFGTITRSATLLDASGDTSFPGTVSANAFSGPLTGNVTGDVSGNAGTATNGVVTTGSYSNPAWITALAAAKITGTLPVGNGGTGATTLTGVLHGNGTGAFTAANVDLATEVTGTLPVANGGTGITAAGASGKVVCWKAAGVLGVCGDAPGASGTCTCN